MSAFVWDDENFWRDLARWSGQAALAGRRGRGRSARAKRGAEADAVFGVNAGTSERHRFVYGDRPRPARLGAIRRTWAVIVAGRRRSRTMQSVTIRIRPSICVFGNRTASQSECFLWDETFVISHGRKSSSTVLSSQKKHGSFKFASDDPSVAHSKIR
jgi:hypothetical protein